MAHKTATYYFIGKLSPEESCIWFNPREIQLGGGWVLDIFKSGIALWNPKVDRDAPQIREFVKDTLDTVVTTFNFLTKLKLKHTVTNLIEARDVVSTNNLIWWYLPEFYVKRPASSKNKWNRTWRKVGKFYRRIGNSFYHKIALRDFQNCIDSVGDDSFFYAFRIVEDIRRATTSHLPPGKETADYWAEMHKILGTREATIRPLTEVSTKVRHGDFNDPIVLRARAKKDEIINIALDVMKRAFKLKFKGLFPLI